MQYQQGPHLWPVGQWEKWARKAESVLFLVSSVQDRDFLVYLDSFVSPCVSSTMSLSLEMSL